MKAFDTIPTSFLFGRRAEASEDDVLTGTYTTTILVDDLGAAKMTEEQEESIRRWFAERMDREIERAICGETSEYQHSLRAAGVQV